MNFEVKFEAFEEGKERVAAWKGEDRRLGLDFLDRVRRELGVPNLDARRVEDVCRYNWDLAVTCEVSEDTARRLAEKHGLFRESSRVTVRIPRHGLNRYLKIELRTDKDSTTGEIERVWPVWRVDSEAVLKDWEAAGCPLSWAPEGVESSTVSESSTATESVEVEEALKPYPPAFARAKAAKARYDAVYAELAGVVKHLNRRLVNERDPEALEVAGWK